jgi:hypothetical protein
MSYMIEGGGSKMFAASKKWLFSVGSPAGGGVGLLLVLCAHRCGSVSACLVTGARED